MFCSQCGEKIDPGSVFCPNCGKKVEGVSPIHPPKKKGSWQVVIIGALALFLIGLVIGGYILFFKADSPEKVVMRLFKAFEEGDGEALSKLFPEEKKEGIKREAHVKGYTLREVFKELAEGMSEHFRKRDGIKEIRIDKVDIKKKDAKVRYMVFYKNGDEEEGECTLIKEKGKWRIERF